MTKTLPTKASSTKLPSTNKTTATANYQWHNMWNKPLKHDVKCGSTVVLPAGTRLVEIAFRQSHLWRKDDMTDKMVRMNVYRHRGKIYHA